MPRPIKWRKISFMPEHRYFKPAGVKKEQLEEIQLKVEELEAMRLKEIEGLNQAECAKRMEVSRQTFQLIIDEARRKVTSALISGMAIRITGGTYTYNICKYKCKTCGHEFVFAYEAESKECPACGEEELTCKGIDNFCENGCRKRCCKNEVT